MLDATQYVTVPAEFFKKTPRDYSNPAFALIRELVQNSVDAPGCTTIDITINENQLIVTNNGAPMTQDVLINKFLALGGTTKGAGDVGGFGAAKLLIALCHSSYEIVTGNLKVVGSGGSYKLKLPNEPLHGTRTIVSYDPDVFHDLPREVRRLAAAMKWGGMLTFNCQRLFTAFDAPTRRNLEGLGSVKVVKGGYNNLVVRAGGIPMFISYSGYDGMVIVDLKGDTKKILTANRDGLLSYPRSVLDAFISNLSSNARSLKDPVVTCVDYGVELTVVEKAKAKVEKAEAGNDSPELQVVVREPRSIVDYPTLEEVQSERSAERIAAYSPAPVLNSSHPTVTTTPATGARFTVRNETGMKLDRSYLPGTLSAASKRLQKDWVSALRFVHEAMELRGEFATGFVFSEDVTALYESRSGVTTYYVNPVSVEKVYGKSGSFRTMRRRKLDRHDLLAYATHEVIHGALGIINHSEQFSSALTAAMAKVSRHKSKR